MNDKLAATESIATFISPDVLRGDGSPALRTPPGQTLTAKWPVLHYGHVPMIAPEEWTLRIWGLVENEVNLDWDQFGALPKVNVRCDIHCVTHWSRLDNLFTGISTKALTDLAKPMPEAKFVIQHAFSDPGRDWTTNVPLDKFTQDDCMLVTHHDGEPLSPEHGGPWTEERFRW